MLRVGLGALLLLTSACTSFGGTPEGARLARIQRSSNHRDGVFVNTVATHLMGTKGFWETIDRQLNGEEKRRPDAPLPVVSLEPGLLKTTPKSGLRVTWMGHSSLLVEVDGYRVLTDPIWSERCSPVQSIGPQRFHRPPIALDALPKVDAVVISHDHYDHLDEQTIRALAKTGVTFYVPLGVGVHLEVWEVDRAQIVELDWWERASINRLTLVATPARHFSGRGLLDRNRTLWASWAIIGPEHRVYFGGDTGMFPGFKEIGDKLGPFDVTLMPIGAYNVNWADIHLNPEEAVRAHLMVRGKRMLPIHWGTFNLALHDWFEPPERLVRAARRWGVDLLLPKVGQAIAIPEEQPVVRWWRPRRVAMRQARP